MSGKLTFTVSPQRPPELQLSSQLTVCMRAKAMQGGKMTAQMQNILLNLELHSAIDGGIVFSYLFPLFVCFSFFCKMFIIFYSVSARLWNLNLFLGLPCSRAEDNFITGNVHCVLFDSSLSRTQWLNFYKLSFVAQSVLRQLENNSLGNKFFFLSHLFSSP